MKRPGYKAFHAAWIDGTFREKFPRPDNSFDRKVWTQKVRTAADWGGCPEMLSVIVHGLGGNIPISYEGTTRQYRVTATGGSKSTAGSFIPLRSLGLGHGDIVDVTFAADVITIRRAKP